MKHICRWFAIASIAACSSRGGGTSEGESEAEAEAESEAEGEACEPGGGPFSDGLVQVALGPQLGEIQDVTLFGDTLYVCANLDGLNAVDVSNPSSPGPAAVIPIQNPSQDTCNHVIGGGAVLWVSNHVANSFVARVEPAAGVVYRAGGARNYEGIAVDGDRLYVAAHEDGVFVLDAATLDDVDQVTSGIDNAWTVAAAGGVLWVGDQDALRAFDASGAALGSVAVPGLVLDIALSGDTAWLALGSGGIASVDVSSPASSALLASLDTPGSAQALGLEGALLAVADWDGLRVYDVADPASPVLSTAETDVGDRVLALDAGAGFVFAGEWRRIYAFSADTAARGPEIRLEPDARVNMGVVGAGEEDGFALLVHNDGTECLDVAGFAVEDGAPLTVDEEPFTLAPGGVAVVELVVAPTTAGPGQATVTIETNDADEASLDLLVQWNQPGTGVGDAAVDFTLPDEDANVWSLSGCAGSCVLLAYFATA